MSEAFVIEVAGEAVGAIFRELIGFRFVSLKHTHLPLDGKMFASVVLRSFVTDDLMVLVTLEEQTATIAGMPQQPWSLRVTQVYRREQDQWKVVHRHADPLVRPRSMAETLALLAQ
ncbi:MAG: SnoaL-like domain-containing protein [Alphaproteobacteria bacterium]|nr:SnoaL-like domain-containing protein [Alphaproteobacteria bacterium]